MENGNCDIDSGQHTVGCDGNRCDINVEKEEK